MFSKFISVGDKIEMQAMTRDGDDPLGTPGKIYHSAVQDIQSEDMIEITMPMEKNKLVLLPVDSEFDLIFYGTSGLFQCLARIVDRYKSNNKYLLLVEMISNLRKYQRREFYRLGCALEMSTRTLQKEEVITIESKMPYTLEKGLPLKQSVIVDISGGGLRFISTQRYEPGSLIYCSYHLLSNGDHKKYEVISRVISSIELSNRKGTFEHRVQFYDLDPTVREEIIKYIFEEERRNRLKQKYSSGTEQGGIRRGDV